MAGIHLHEIFDKLNTVAARQRHSALNDLQVFLAREDASNQLHNDNNCGLLFGALLDNFTKELAFSRRSKSAQALQAVQLSAECFKALIEKTRLLMGRSNVKAAVEHILQHFPDKDGPEYADVAPSFCASLRLIFSHPPHLEQLKPEFWDNVVEFCISKIEVSSHYTLPASHNDSFEATQMEVDSLPMRKEIGDLIFTLQSFVNYPGAPLWRIREPLVIFLLNFLASYNTISDARLSAVISLNRMLWHISINDIAVVKVIALHVLDLASRIWDARIPGLRERILVSISTVYPHLYRMALDDELVPSTFSTIQKLLNILKREARFDDRKSRLQLDDLILSPLPRGAVLWNQLPFHSLIGPFFALNPHPPSSEFPWMILQIQSSLMHLLDLGNVEEFPISRSNDFEHHAKRRRLASINRLHTFVDDILSSKTNNIQMLGSLQRLAFCLNDFRLPDDSFDFPWTLRNLETVRDMGDLEIVGWSLLCIVCIIGRISRSGISGIKSETWMNVWIACVKYAAISSTCRPASAVMERIVSNRMLPATALVPHVKGIMEFIEQRGPANLVDNACDFWNSVLHSFEDAGVSTERWRRDALSRWIQYRLDAAKTNDGLSTGERFSTLFFPLLRLFTTDKWTSAPNIDYLSVQFRPHGPIGEFLATQGSNLPLLNFLLDGSLEEDTARVPVMTAPNIKLSCPWYLREFLESRYQRFCDEYIEDGETVGSGIAQEELSWLVGFTLVTMLLLRAGDSRGLLKAVTKMISIHRNRQACVDSCLRGLEQLVHIIDLRFTQDEVAERALQSSIQSLFQEHEFKIFIEGLFSSAKIARIVGSNSPDVYEFHLGNQQIFSSDGLDQSWALRDISRSSCTTESWRLNLLVRLHSEVNAENPLRPDYVQLLDTQSLLLAQPTVTMAMFNSNATETADYSDDAVEMFERINKTYVWVGNDMAINFGIGLISGILSKSGTGKTGPQGERQFDRLYRWMIKVVINRSLSSVQAKLGGIRVLRELSRIDLAYGDPENLESTVGTLLIRLLKDVESRVQYEIGKSIAPIFQQFPFGDRVDVYHDIVGNLEGDPQNAVGFALRAFTLTHLAFAADDIRRAAMVNLLELAKFRAWKTLVQACFAYISKRLYGGSLTNVFLQNSSQFIFSYIEFDEIIEFPYDVFGFPSLCEWADAVAEELVAQLLNAGRWDETVAIFCNGCLLDEVLRKHLARIISYYYLSLHSSEESAVNLDATVLDRCKACLGADFYVTSLRSDFARVLSIMTERLDDRSLSPESFLSVNMSSVSSNFASIALPRLSPKHPQPLPPYFSVHAVIAAMAHLADDLGLLAQQAWTPAVSIFVLRHLFDQAHDTSDNTVALSFLRRIAFIVSLASDALKENYPLEMPILSLRAFLTRDSTHEESTQILKYMLNLGKQSFAAQPQQFSRLVAFILPSIQTNDLRHVGRELVHWLHMFVGSISPRGSEIEEVSSLLGFILDSETSSKDLADIFHNLLQRDPSIWGEEEFLQFALTCLPDHSDVLTQSLSTLEGLIYHFRNVRGLPSSSDKSKRWVGLAIGRLAQERKFEAQEYVSMMQRQGKGISATDLLLREVLKRLRSDTLIAGLLEQSLRTIASITGCRKQDDEVFAVLKYLSSSQIPASLELYQSQSISSPPSHAMWTHLDGNVPRWIQLFAASISQHTQDPILNSLVPPINASTNFAKAIFPFLVDKGRFDPNYSSGLTTIFNSILGSAGTVDTGYLKHILEVVVTIRERSLTDGQREIEPLLDQLDYLHAANAAVACRMYKTGLMFLELARGNDGFSGQLQSFEILSIIYRNLDDPDLPYALSKGVQRTWSQLFDVYSLHNNREVMSGLHRARLRCKAELGVDVSSQDTDLEAVADFLRFTGFPFKFEDSLPESDDANSAIDSIYKSAWRLGTWDLPPLSISQIPDTLIYSILFELDHGKSSDSISSVLHSSITQLVDKFYTSSTALEQMNSAVTLSLFGDLSQLLSPSGSFSTIARNWKSQIIERGRFGRFEAVEPSASLHNAILKIADHQSQNPESRVFRDGNDDYRPLLVESILAFCEMTRMCGGSDDLLVALAKTGFLEEKFNNTEHFKEIFPAILTERAEILWSLNEKIEAIESLQTLIDNRPGLSYSLVPEEVISANLAAWTAEMRLSPSDVIVDKFLNPAVRSLESRSDTVGTTAGKVFFEYASFCLTQLEDSSFLEDLERVKRLYDSKQSEVFRFQDALKKDPNLRLKRDKEKAEKDRRIDEEELARLSVLLQTLTTKAIENFLRCFASCNNFDHHVPKFCALWLKHFDQPFANHAVAQRIKSVPSYKFIPLMHQLCARLSSETTEFQENLKGLLLRALNDHPFHVFPQMYSTMHASDKSKVKTRLKPAKSLVDRMSYSQKVGNVSVKDLSVRLAAQYESYSALADIPLNKSSPALKFSSYPQLQSFRSASTLPPPSMPIPLSVQRHYSNVASIQKYMGQFILASGINRPRIVDCTLSDGTGFRELVKGGIDDLRQDAIMQQVFQEMDGVLKRNRETRRRDIGIRTYRVVPLKATTGVIQWVIGTIPVAGYLEKKHASQNPNDWAWQICQNKIKDVQQDRFEMRLKVFQNVCSHFKPVLRFFFLETFKHPDAWFSRQIHFSRTVAAASMIGHIVGLGDRHGHNILLDTATGEVVHIDLGIAFEQGKLLPVGEVVPFRLTRDIVDGFGVSGCEGPFLRASTFALTVFRQEQNTIFTLLDVLKHDPLYQWTISPLKLLQVQQELQQERAELAVTEQSSSELSNADRAINVVKRKLASRLSPEADVRRLVLEATDPGNLSRMFCGWAAFS